MDGWGLTHLSINDRLKSMSRRIMFVVFPKKEIQKNESIEISYQGYFDIILGWDGIWKGKYVDDIDLCVFYKTKAGETGGVHTKEYNGLKTSEGSLTDFPYIFYMGEDRPNQKYADEEIIRIANIHEMEKVYIVAIDYCAAVEDESGFDIPVTLDTTDTNPIVTMNFSRARDMRGSVLILASLKESDDTSIVFTNNSELMSVSDAFREIPGFASIIIS